ncbi:MAG TPA: N-acetylglucosamine-6-phosphate deacetylase, partial [Cellvibrionaceae bacterium]
MKQVLTGARIFTGSQFLDNKALVINGSEIFCLAEHDNVVQDAVNVELNGGILAPGFIDLQVNGGGGAFFTNAPNIDTLKTMLDGHRPTGTTSMLPTLISATRDTHQAGIDAVRAAVAENMAGILGIHLEGPFFDLEKRGAHNAEFIRAISEDDLTWLCDTRGIKTLLTLAPEHVAPGQITQLVEAGIRVSAGHSNARYREVKAAIDAGLSGFTHLYNAMRPQTGREPGVVGAALECGHSWCGIICDNHHVHPASVRVACKSKPRGKIYLVTDAMSTVGSANKSFSLYGETITEKNGALVNAEGRLAGSAIGMIDAVRIAHTDAHLTLDECLRMASLYPAQYMRVDHMLGKIAPAFRADLVHFTNDFNVTATWV